ncbi:hypothetical protein BD626DRAFT_223979 [Schizophyllum amplum]|uniref:SH3 domain-containing protein n=1 Tax=Schizophyllum amplum TaxID=97359 RepID=A0A550BXG0_9AGAR|nr:hypothetical protein BD626DRAFT_223979 [Auriculariopsis ampla]
MAAASEPVFTRPQAMDVDGPKPSGPPAAKPHLSPLITPTVSGDPNKTPVPATDKTPAQTTPTTLTGSPSPASARPRTCRTTGRASARARCPAPARPSRRRPPPTRHRRRSTAPTRPRSPPAAPPRPPRASPAAAAPPTGAQAAPPAAAPAPPPPRPPPLVPHASRPPRIRDYAYPPDDPRHVGTGFAPPASSAPNELAEGWIRIAGEGEWERKRGSGWSSDHSTADGDSKGPWGGEEGWAGLGWMGRLSWQFKNSVASGGGSGSTGESGGGTSQGAARYTDSDGRIDLDRAAAPDDEEVATEPDVDSPARLPVSRSQSRSPHPQYDEDSQAYDDSRVEGGEEESPAPAPGIYRAAYAFGAEGPAEMSVRTGQLVRVLGGGGAGWAVAVRGWRPRGPEKEKLQRRVQELGLAEGDEESAEEDDEEEGEGTEVIKDAKEGKEGKHALVPESYLDLVRADGVEDEGA